MKKLQYLFFILSFICLSACNDKENIKSLLEQADIQYQEKNYVEAHKLWEKATNLGSGEAAYNLSELYALGNGVEKNIKRYFELLESSASKGELKALKRLGQEYYSGNAITRDYGKAFPLLKEAAIRGDIESQTNLGRMYRYGLGVEKDPKKALEWYEKAANENDASAFLEIGRMYVVGDGVKKDINIAVLYFEKSIVNSEKLIDISHNGTVSFEIYQTYSDAFLETGNVEYRNNSLIWSKKFQDFRAKEKELFGKF
mgnify:CR=1 FL=1